MSAVVVMWIKLSASISNMPLGFVICSNSMWPCDSHQHSLFGELVQPLPTGSLLNLALGCFIHL